MARSKAKYTKERAEEWQKDHWRAVALCDLIMTAHSREEEELRLAELRRIKEKWGHTLITGYDPYSVRSGKPESAKGVSKNIRGPAEEYVPPSGSVGARSSPKAP